ncbi:uncharacterized protein N7443_000026 [Penicillium atrosanguineum]|uniref:uncharacterized protein n=1 Tax=Penicillium atrosanguineum TaxID=1132637 RepID=UPI00239BC7D3|nr:uncharacterized protein N7443_000026 [Penicillium atrosanguineum]KAJ5148400.1 hypothetical protein N7526_001752 [Penicillium atrosanguineum]KAJ5313142.1 hypothetical protein N7443_000026 [Penicillium atrosanguineum]
MQPWLVFYVDIDNGGELTFIYVLPFSAFRRLGWLRSFKVEDCADLLAFGCEHLVESRLAAGLHPRDGTRFQPEIQCPNIQPLVRSLILLDAMPTPIRGGGG